MGPSCRFRFATLRLRFPSSGAADAALPACAATMGWEIDGVTLEQREAVQPPPPPGEAAAAAGLIDDLQSPGNKKRHLLICKLFFLIFSTQSVVGALTFDQENCDWLLLPAPTPPKSPSLTDETSSTPKNASIVSI